MKSFKGIALGFVCGALFLSGCTGVNHWWEREHALMPLKEQYWNGELSWNEYRDKKEALIADLNQHGYKGEGDIGIALREAIDSHHSNREADSREHQTDDTIILRQDNAMIQDSEKMPTTQAEVSGMAAAETATEAPSNEMLRQQQAIDYGLLSRSIKTNNEPSAPRNTGIVLTSEPSRAQESAPSPASSQESVSDSTQVKWRKQADGTVIYQDPTDDSLNESELK